jgi:putative sterol carrier protein
VATIEECTQALEGILGDLASSPAAKGMDRSLSCRLTDLGKVARARLADSQIKDMEVVDDDPSLAPADIRLTMSSDDLVALTTGELSFAPAWASGRVKLEAALRDMFKLRSML